MQTAYIGMGSNLPGNAGLPDATLAAAATRLASLGRVVARSSLYSTAPVGFAGQPRFLNAVITLETGLAPHTLLMRLLALERDFRRDRGAGIPNGPRTLDLDILMLGDLCVHEAGLEIPHPRLAERAFVLIPLNEIAPQAVEPRHRKTVAELLHRLLESRKGESDAVVQIQSEAWRIGGNTADPASSSRTDLAPDRSHRGG
jgi:2-amino-4-hydroxy-6-hydroxymethyldihydropteridine diphosphokinase